MTRLLPLIARRFPCVPRRSAVARLLAVLVLAALVASPAPAAIINLPDITVNSLAHTYQFSSGGPFGDNGQATDRINTLGTGSSGSYSTTTYFGHATAGDTITQRLLAPSGQKFSVYRDANFSQQQLRVEVSWIAAGDGVQGVLPLVTFENPVGAAPTVNYSFAGLGDNGNAINAAAYFDVTNDFSFTELRLAWTPSITPTSLADRTFTLGSPTNIMFGTLANSGSNYDAVTMAITPVPEPAFGGLVVGGLVLAATSLTRRRARNAGNDRT